MRGWNDSWQNKAYFPHNRRRFSPMAAIPNYADRHRHGEPIATGFVESAVNQVVSKRLVKRQQMRWTLNGAHRLLQVRVRVLNQQLRGNFERWHPELERFFQANYALISERALGWFATRHGTFDGANTFA